MTEHEEIIEEIRFITDYPEAVYSDSEIESGIQFTKKEIRGILGDFERDWFSDEYPNVDRALMWGTCYHLKVKSGELGGLPMSIGDVDMSHFSDRGEHYSAIIDWVGNFYEYLEKVRGGIRRFGSVSVSREDRTYENDPDPYKEQHET